jgi:hypothetical protein
MLVLRSSKCQKERCDFLSFATILMNNVAISDARNTEEGCLTTALMLNVHRS